MSALEKRQRQLETEPVQDAPTDSVKLNVGGTYFTLSLGTLTKEPDSFFSAMFSGRWDVKTNPEDDAVFVDRDPVLFGMIANYMRTGEIDLDDMSIERRRALHKEADFYLITSLTNLIPCSTFSTEIRGHVHLSMGNSRVTRMGVSVLWYYVISSAAFSPSVREMRVKLIRGKNVMIGVAPRLILVPGNDHYGCGWHISTYDGCLDSQDGDRDTPFKSKIDEGSVITVKVDDGYNISFSVDDEDWGIAYENVVTGQWGELFLLVSLGEADDCVMLL